MENTNQLSLRQAQVELSEGRRLDIIDLFKKNDNRLMVSSEIAEEIKGCTLQELRSTIQHMGIAKLIKSVKLNRAIDEHAAMAEKGHKLKLCYCLTKKALAKNPTRAVYPTRQTKKQSAPKLQPANQATVNKSELQRAIELAESMGKKVSI